MPKLLFEVEHGNKKWQVWDDGSQTGFPTGSVIRLHSGAPSPEIRSAAKKANDDYYSWKHRVNRIA